MICIYIHDTTSLLGDNLLRNITPAVKCLLEHLVHA